MLTGLLRSRSNLPDDLKTQLLLRELAVAPSAGLQEKRNRTNKRLREHVPAQALN